ncbi:MAG: phenylalanine--tRNA ligase subunit alpha [Candidatus Magasanikbacteria bacterium]|nr:phenylalanine--tRNA ligase subunit alpha [Candidatus Magasanikbacteria bacterium]
MNKKLEQIKKEFEKGLRDISNLSDLILFEERFFSRKSGAFTLIMKKLKDFSAEARREAGSLANTTKSELQALLLKKKTELSFRGMAKIAETEAIDLSEPSLDGREKGHLHPITQSIWELEEIAKKMGFVIEDGPEIESDYYIFDALNIPEFHPAREAQDTFYIKDHPHWTMRSHVSGMQVRQMRRYGAPLRAVHLGRVFRNEALDATHGHTFYQFDCIVVDKNLTIGNLVGVIKTLLEGLYKRKVELRLRPAFFPFVEPGFEMEMKVSFGLGKDQKTKWTEIVGCGMIHPHVIRAGGLDPAEHDGFAFSLGVDRLVMGKYGVEDIRHIHSGDLRFLKQF